MQTTKKHLKVAVTGGAGQIGYALLFRLASGQAFGHDVTLDLQLLEVEPALGTLSGVVMELIDCAFPLVKNIEITADPTKAFAGANWVVCVGSVPRKVGMERSDVLLVNAHIFSAHGKAISAVAAKDVKVFVVGNPCNTNCLIAMHNAKDVPQDRFFAMTFLDQNRAVAQLAQKAKVGVNEVENMIVWGNHSATQFPDFYHAKIQGKSVVEVIRDEKWLQTDFITTIQQRGAEILKVRGGSSVASAANAVIDGLWHLSHEISAPYSMALCSRGEYGVDEGLIFSFPCITERSHIKVQEGVTHNAFSKEKIAITLNELREEREMVRKMQLI